jgi:hypothetical protein
MSNLYPKDYKPEKSGGSDRYRKASEVEGKIRILKPRMLATRHWMTNDKPCRIKPGMTLADVGYGIGDVRDNKFRPGNGDIQKVEIYEIWNHETKQTEILELHQKTITDRLHELYLDSDWGDYREYDIKIKMFKEGDKTKYVVTPVPSKKLEAEVEEYRKEHPIILENLYASKDKQNGGDPFNGDNSKMVEEVVNDADLPF